MCRSTDLLHPSPYTHDSAAPNIKAIFVHVRTSASTIPCPNSSLSSSILLIIISHSTAFSVIHSLTPYSPRSSASHGGDVLPGLFPFNFFSAKGALIEQDQNRWTLDCKSQFHLLQLQYFQPTSEVQLCFAFDDGNLAATHWVRLVNPKEREKNCVNFGHLEQIPEEMELPSEDSHEVVDLERLRRTVDLGIWVLCLGLAVGYLVSRASVRKFRPYLNF